MKYGKSPPDEGNTQETLEASGPLWRAVARLIDDEESAHDMHCQLRRAMVTRGLAEVLSQESAAMLEIHDAALRVLWGLLEANPLITTVRQAPPVGADASFAG